MQTKTILQAIIQDEGVNDYPLFRQYCVRKEQGLRKDALNVLQSFIEEMKENDFEVQREFAAWLFQWIERFEDGYHLLVYPLVNGVIQPVFQTWEKVDPLDVRPYRWQGLFVHQGEGLPHLLKALELGGSKEQRVIVQICEIYLSALWYSFHHIHEDLYLSTYEKDQERIQGIENVMMLIQNKRIRTNVQKQAVYYGQLLKDWMAFQQTETRGFMTWCAERKKPYEWVEAFYYQQ
ncbi:hypothetical protein ACTHOS_14705 [Bacillus safensis]|uniref:hypothetical protein n=1 Tax=Bacillus TaxID=1386 RepID=UPI0007FB507C|nr:hypothetical protein [Bacillus safensis]MEC0921089.1 hypothetical protein [Bacillus safensis]MEC0993285.1 hypothetical protein [Bacillus safensis]MEC1000383.1 hypothetical protein [Bacillus safensis]MEC2427358.1 hypothetical protein [Bacillus safensis]MED0803363.1 hypothetical protein [Bacillus safensis]